MTSFTTSVMSMFELAALSEADNLEKYYSANVSDNSSPFSNFTQDHRDAYIRLKFRAINESKKSQL